MTSCGYLPYTGMQHTFSGQCNGNRFPAWWILNRNILKSDNTHIARLRCSEIKLPQATLYKNWGACPWPLALPPLLPPPPNPLLISFFLSFFFFLFFSFSFLSSCCISLVPAFSSKLDMCPLHSSIFTSNRPRYLWLGWASSWEMRTWAIPTSSATHMPVSKGGSLMNTCFSQNNYVSWKILVLLLFCPFFPFSLEHREAKGFFFSLRCWMIVTNG